MKKFEGPITGENFREVWDYVDGKLIEIQKKKVIRKVLAYVTNIVFFCCVLMATYASVYSVGVPELQTYLESLAPLAGVWSVARVVLEYPQLPLGVQIGIYIFAAILVTTIICGICTLIVWAVYRPNMSKSPTEDAAEDSKSLSKMYQEAAYRAEHVQNLGNSLAAMLYMVVVIAGAVFFLKFLIENRAVELIMAIFNMFVGAAGVYGMQLAVPGIGALYLVLAGIQNSILKLTCYGTRVNPEIRDMIQAYYYECNAEEKARIEEEERILKLAQEIKLRRKQENVEFVEEMNKKNPIFKYIKIGIAVIIAVGGVMFAMNYLQSIDIQSILQGGTPSTESTENPTENGTETSTESVPETEIE